jgi:hypothetical protein
MAIREISISVGTRASPQRAHGRLLRRLAAVEAVVLAAWDFRELKTRPRMRSPVQALEA